MNKKYMIKIPLKNEPKEALSFNVNLLLYPYYISESALLAIFTEEHEYTKYRSLAREIIFNASLRAYEFSYNKMGHTLEEHKLIFRRELALCLAMNAFSNHFYKDLYSSLSRSKSYADFSVSTTVKNDGVLLKEMIANSSNCIIEAKKVITDSYNISNSLGKTSVKGVLNPGNSFSYRTWIHSNLPIKSSSILGNNKIWYQGNLYKDDLTYVSES